MWSTGWGPHVKIRRRRNIDAVRSCSRFALLPSPVVDRVLVGGAGGDEAPTQSPLVVVVESVARVRGQRGVQQSGQLEVFEVDQAARFLEQIVSVFFRVLVD